MNGIDLSERPISRFCGKAPIHAPTIDELLVTLRTLFYYRKRCVLQTGGVLPYLLETIRFLELLSPPRIKNIINLMYNS